MYQSFPELSKLLQKSVLRRMTFSVQAASPDAADALRDFDYPPVAAVTLAYPLSAIREDRKGADGKLPGI